MGFRESSTVTCRDSLTIKQAQAEAGRQLGSIRAQADAACTIMHRLAAKMVRPRYILRLLLTF